jgi:GNAT superfamily N-acetyltransferase
MAKFSKIRKWYLNHLVLLIIHVDLTVLFGEMDDLLRFNPFPMVCSVLSNCDFLNQLSNHVGEEVTVCYDDAVLSLPRANRQHVIADGYHFECQCTRCNAGEDDDIKCGLVLPPSLIISNTDTTNSASATRVMSNDVKTASPEPTPTSSDAKVVLRHASVVYREMTMAEIPRISEINRAEEITHSYVVDSKENKQQLQLTPTAYSVTGWQPGQLPEIIKRQQLIHSHGGCVIGAFTISPNNIERLIGIISVEKERFGTDLRYSKLDLLHVDAAHRGTGVAKQLLQLAGHAAKHFGGTYLYISATPTKHTVDWYMRQGAVLCRHIDTKLFELEPDDIHMELAITSGAPLVASLSSASHSKLTLTISEAPMSTKQSDIVALHDAMHELPRPPMLSSNDVGSIYFDVSSWHALWVTWHKRIDRRHYYMREIRSLILNPNHTGSVDRLAVVRDEIEVNACGDVIPLLHPLKAKLYQLFASLRFASCANVGIVLKELHDMDHSFDPLCHLYDIIPSHWLPVQLASAHSCADCSGKGHHTDEHE